MILAWGLLVWQMYAVRAAGPGMRLLKLQLVGYTDGRPIGWGRFFLRWLVLRLLAATGIGLLLMIIFLVLHPRRQGWHDLAADSVVIKERVLAPPRPVEAPAGHRGTRRGAPPPGRWPPRCRRCRRSLSPSKPAVYEPEVETATQQPVATAAMDLRARRPRGIGARWTSAGTSCWTTAARSRSRASCSSAAIRSPEPVRRTPS